MVVQWFPKIGVFQEKGWNCHQFHASSEFFSDFGNYDVSIDVPARYKGKVGATGRAGRGARDLRAAASSTASARRASTTSPGRPTRAISSSRTPSARRGSATCASSCSSSPSTPTRPSATSEPPRPRSPATVASSAAIPTPRSRSWTRPGARTARAAWSTRRSSPAARSWSAPKAVHRPEGVTVHEAGHQFFYGLIASNEFEEAWLDEGFNTYMTDRVMKAVYGPNHVDLDVFGLHFPLGIDIHYPLDVNRRYFEVADWDVLASESWKFRERRSYGGQVYSKTALTLATLERLLGTPTMDRALRLYADRWRFRHPTTRDFIAAVNDATGADWTWFFDRTFFSSGIVDYAVGDAESEARAPAARPLREGRHARRKGPPPALAPRSRLRHRRHGRPPRRRGDARRRAAALRGRPRIPLALGRGGALEALPRRLGAAPDRGASWIPTRRSSSMPTARTTAAAPRTGPARRDAMDGARGLLGPEHDRLHDGGLVRSGSAQGARLLPARARPLALEALPRRGALADPAHARRGADPADRQLAPRPARPLAGGRQDGREPRLRLVGDGAPHAPGPASATSPRSRPASSRPRASAGRSCRGCAGSGPPRSRSRCSRSSSTPSLSAACSAPCGSRRASLVTFGREGMRRMPAFLLFTFAALGAAFAAYQWIYVGSGEALRDRVRGLHTEQAALAVTALRLAAVVLALAVIKLLADSVRTVWVARPDLPPVSRFLFGIGGAIGRPLRLFGILGLYAVDDRGPLPRLARPRSLGGRRGAVRAGAADPDAAGLRLRPAADQDRLLRRASPRRSRERRRRSIPTSRERRTSARPPPTRRPPRDPKPLTPARRDEAALEDA